MTQTELAMLMNNLGQSDAVFDPVASITFIAEFLERTEPLLEKSDYKNLLYAGACICKLLENGAA
ncbi:MAG: hypothetical protein JWR74_1484 [Polaromonas sp.]|jgi:hypothetical protein|nr:hypothetical protein [Polaromonas sp.]